MRWIHGFLVVFVLACGSKPGADPVSADLAARFSEERAWTHLQNLVAMGPRAPGTPGHERAQRYIRKHLEALGATVEDIPLKYQARHESAPRDFTNITGLIGGRDGSWILLGAHYDTRPWGDLDDDPMGRARPIVGANDGGSGVAVLLEIARVVAEAGAEPGLEVAFFDGEDFGRAGELEDYLVGSRYMAKHWKRLRPNARPEAVVIVDMVGDAELEIFQERTGAQRFPALTKKLFDAARRQNEGAFVPRLGQAIIDDHTPFLQIGFPAAVLIDLDYPPWHTQDDTLDKCSPLSLGSAGRVVLEAFYSGSP